MKKKIIFALVCLTIMTACVKQDKAPIYTDTILPNDYDIKTVNQYRGYGNGNENGFYFCDINEDASINIKYIDYTTLQEIYLCARPECEHNNDTCTSYLKAGGNTVTPYVLENKLCVMYSGAGQGYFELYGKQALPHIDIMDFNGENKKTIVELDINDRIIGNVAFDKNTLFCIKQNVVMENQSVKVANYLIGIDLVTGKTIKEIKMDLLSPEFYGSYNDKIYIKETIAGKIFSESIIEIWEFSLIDDEINLNTSWNTQETNGVAYKDNIYLTNKKSLSLTKYNLQDKNKTEICVVENQEAQNLVIEHMTQEGMAICYKTNDREYNPIYIDVVNCKIYNIQLPLISDDKQFMGIPDIMGETKDKFLIAINSYYADVGFLTPKGEKNNFLMWKHDLALIDKKNYINSVPKYKKIQKQL